MLLGSPGRVSFPGKRKDGVDTAGRERECCRGQVLPPPVDGGVGTVRHQPPQ